MGAPARQSGEIEIAAAFMSLGGFQPPNRYRTWSEGTSGAWFRGGIACHSGATASGNRRHRRVGRGVGAVGWRPARFPETLASTTSWAGFWKTGGGAGCTAAVCAALRSSTASRTTPTLEGGPASGCHGCIHWPFQVLGGTRHGDREVPCGRSSARHPATPAGAEVAWITSRCALLTDADLEARRSESL